MRMMELVWTRSWCPVGNETWEIANEINENRGAVFYIPVQEFNRDISLTVIREFNKIHNEELAAKQKEPRKIKILEALAATGLRSVRYLKEIDNSLSLNNTAINFIWNAYQKSLNLFTFIIYFLLQMHLMLKKYLLAIIVDFLYSYL